MQAKQAEAQEAAMADARKAHAEAKVRQDRQLAAAMLRQGQSQPEEFSL
jgi:hypothetical protein